MNRNGYSLTKTRCSWLRVWLLLERGALVSSDGVPTVAVLLPRQAHVLNPQHAKVKGPRKTRHERLHKTKTPVTIRRVPLRKAS